MFFLFGLFQLCLFHSCDKPYKPGFSQYVNPFIGTGGHGHTFPGATLPFGMVQLSPDTRLEGWDGCSGYHYSDSIIYGFTHTHLSGTGCSDYGDILFMPTVGKVQVFNGTPENPDEGYCSRFLHSDEKASAGYYSVLLKDYGVKAELTTTTRVGIHKYTFPASTQSNIIIDLTHRDKVLDSYIKFNGDNEVEGYRYSQAWATDQRVYFVARFSKSFINKGIIVDEINVDGQSEAKGKNLKAFLNFNTASDEPVIIKVGISGVSIEGARINLEAEAKSWNFEEYKANAAMAWDEVLGKIKVEGPVKNKNIFYTSLYHSYICPNTYSDVDGSYRSRDNKIHSADNFTYYTVFSLWDTYRALHPLMTILEPEKTNDFIKTFLAQYEQGGLLPVWELSANETNCMIAYHSVSVIYDAWAKGIQGFDGNLALEAMKASAGVKNNWADNYVKNGCLLANEEGESVSKTLEYSYDDWCIARMAKSLNSAEDYKNYIQRAQFYKNVFDDSTGFMRARLNGTWFSPFLPTDVNFNYTEANAWQYSFYVPQDINGLMTLMGGKEKFAAKLDSMFNTSSQTTGREQSDITGMIGQYAHGNEPSHHMAYLYNFAGQPWKTQEVIHEIQTGLYTDSTNGLCGNEDCGQMSAWYVFSSMGFYPVTPGSDNYIIGTPLFSKTEIKLNNGKVFTVKANNLSDKSFYIKSATLNGKHYNKCYFTHSDLLNGGELVFEMSDKPSDTWGVAGENIPMSEIKDNLIVPVPFIVNGKRAFSGSFEIELHDVLSNCNIFYTLDNTEPSLLSLKYEKPFKVYNPTTIKAVAVDQNGNTSKVMVSELSKIREGVKVKILSKYSPQYSGGGDEALIDGIRGGMDFRTGEYQGYQGVDLTAIIDIGRNQKISEVGASFLQDINPWIFFPSQVDFYLSVDGKSFVSVASVMNNVPRNKWGAMKKEFKSEIKPKNARYIKVIVHNPGLIPEWHPGAGYPSYFFIDEVFFN